MKPTETFKETNIDQRTLVLEVYGQVGSVAKMCIGTRFENFISIYPARSEDYQSSIDSAFDFFRNYAPLLEVEELKESWSIYKKALMQKTDTVSNAFWNMRDGKTIKFLNRQKTAFEWIKTDDKGEEIISYYVGCHIHEADCYLTHGFSAATKLTTSLASAKESAREACNTHNLDGEHARVIIVESTNLVTAINSKPKDMIIVLA